VPDERQPLKKKDQRGGKIDWQRLCLLLGHYWSWITPTHFFFEMTFAEVTACIEHVLAWEITATSRENYRAKSRALLDWIAPSGKQDLSFIKGRMGKVIKAHG
jgi:hypothetical protein